jgi:hypothetical protein
MRRRVSGDIAVIARHWKVNPNRSFDSTFEELPESPRLLKIQIGIQAFSVQQSVSAKKQKSRPKLRYLRGMYDFAAKSFCSRLRDFGCPDTLIKDVRDVAAAVCAARGRDGSEEV